MTIAQWRIDAAAEAIHPIYFGHGKTILMERERIKRQTIAKRRFLHRRQAE